MKKWIAIALFLLPSFASAQAPDMDAIEAQVRNVASPHYYPVLMERYARGDSLLGREEYRHLYYGYIFSPAYEPHAPIPQIDSLLMILQQGASATREDYLRMIRYGETVMAHDPFNPRVLNFMTYAYGQTGDAPNERRSARRFDGVMDAIISSGEGDRERSPWHILYFSHAEDVLDYFGAAYKQPMVVGRTLEYFPLVQRQGSVRGYYFDYAPVYSKPAPPAEEPRRWRFNGIPIR